MPTILSLSPDKIVIPEESQRKSFDPKKLESLEANILKVGLIHSIVVDEVESERFVLRCGRRRLRVLSSIISKKLSFKHGDQTYTETVPALRVSDLTEEQRFELELSENIEREDLTWQEKDRALAKLHAFRKKEAEAVGETQTLATTAEEARVAPATVSDAVIIADHLDDPDVAKAKSSKEAMTIIRKKAESRQRVELLQKFDPSKTPHLLIHGDCRKVEYPSKYRVLINDAPYGIGADSFGDQSGTGHSYDDSPKSFKELVAGTIPVLERVSEGNSFLYWFCDIRWFEWLHLEFTLGGWKCWHRPLIWDKVGTGMVPDPEHGPRNSYECILYGWRGNVSVLRKAAPDVLSYAPPKRLLHGAQKPVELYVDLLTRVAQPGERIADLFCGSGTVFVAANRLRLIATGAELDESQVANAHLRIGSKEIGEEQATGDQAEDLVL